MLRIGLDFIVFGGGGSEIPRNSLALIMELQGRKYDLIQFLVNTEDVHLLQKLESVVRSHQYQETNNETSKGVHLAVREGIEQLDR